MHYEELQYGPIPSNESDIDYPTHGAEREFPTSSSQRRLKVLVGILTFLMLATNVGWALAYNRDLRERNVSSTATEMQQATYPPARTLLQPIYQDTEFNEDGVNKERSDNLWKSLFPSGNGVISLNKSEAKANGLHDTAVDPVNKENGLYIVAGFHTMHCVTVIRTALWHYHEGEEQSAPWSHLVHCLDMIRQTLMCNLDTTVMWLWDPDTFADGQLHVCKDFWGLHQWMTEHAAY